jgi:hypothetical protein
MSDQEDFIHLRNLLRDPGSDIVEVIKLYHSVFWHLDGGMTSELIDRLVTEVKQLRATQSPPDPPEPKAARWRKASLEAEDPVNGTIRFRRQVVGGVSVWEALSSGSQRGYGLSPDGAMISMLNERSRKP